ncbi:MAG: response regulator [Chitinivibrionales bacterium]|nr:response regulator [Chitinivibrionales bacterium]
MELRHKISRLLFSPAVSHHDQIIEWKLNAFYKLLSVLLLAFLIPIFFFFTVFGEPVLIGISFLFVIATFLSYRLVLRKQLAPAVYLVLICSTLTSSYYLVYTGKTDASYLLSFNVLMAGLFLGKRAAFLWAFFYTLLLFSIALFTDLFTFLPPLVDYFARSPDTSGVESHFSTALFLIWATAFVSLLFQKYFAELLAKIKHANMVLERKVDERTDELNSVNKKLADALATERTLKSEAQKKAKEERSKLQSELFQAQKMEAIGHLAGGVAHDFNNLLTVITGYAGLLEIKLDEASSLLGYVQEIRKAGSRAAELTNQLLVFARKGKFQSKAIAVHEIIREVVALLERTIDKRVSINLDFNARPSTTTGDSTQIQNALLNLGINARDAMAEKGGVLTFATRIEMVARSRLLGHSFILEPGTYIAISVSDTGTGIDRNTMDHIFEPFFTTKEKGKGTGLGLAAVYGCAKHHQGCVEVQSVLGKGTSFTLYFPVLAAEDNCRETGWFAVGGKSFISGRILIVEDEEAVRNMTGETLEARGYTVVTCDNGIEALEYLSVHADDVDIVLLDMIMPEMNGRDTFYRIREINPSLIVVLISGYNPDGEYADILKLERVAFIQKPFSENQIMTTIESFLSIESQ